MEVLSDSTEERDRGVKFVDYALHGVGEYWIVDPETETVEQYFLEEDTYVLQGALTRGEIAGRVIPGLILPVKAVFDAEEQMKFLARLPH